MNLLILCNRAAEREHLIVQSQLHMMLACMNDMAAGSAVASGSKACTKQARQGFTDGASVMSRWQGMKRDQCQGWRTSCCSLHFCSSLPWARIWMMRLSLCQIHNHKSQHTNLGKKILDSVGSYG